MSLSSSEANVSVLCTAYNHASYIAEALDSFVSQKTTYPYEIIVHDDASTDDTPNIIADYADKFPHLIKPIFQETNQHSKGGFCSMLHAAKMSTGKYLAFCEGDDFWVSDDKIQIQTSVMEENTTVDYSFHPAFRVFEGKRESKASWRYEPGRIFSPAEILSTMSQFAPTSAGMFRREVLDVLPKWYLDTAPIGDFFFEMYGAARGGALFIDQPMSAYRMNAENSWTQRVARGSEQRFEFATGMQKSLDLLEKDFPEYPEAFRKKRAIIHYTMAMSYLVVGKDNDFAKEIEESASEYRFFSPRQRLTFLGRNYPSALRFLLSSKGRMGRFGRLLFPRAVGSE